MMQTIPYVSVLPDFKAVVVSSGSPFFTLLILRSKIGLRRAVLDLLPHILLA
jgi:hypothetical protein